MGLNRDAAARDGGVRSEMSASETGPVLWVISWSRGKGIRKGSNMATFVYLQA